jgi:NCS2 family nucleobase:cation symporter-2
MENVMSSPAASNPIDEVLPVPKLFVLGLQHVLAMYAGAAAVPLIIGGALHLPKEHIAMLVSADLMVCGVVTIIQCVGFLNIGIRLPMVMGVAFTAVPTIIATGSTPTLGMPGVFGAVIASGLFTLIVAPFFSRWVRFFPPVVTGTVMLIIGLSLMRVGINWAAGGQPMIHGPNGMVPNPAYGQPENLAIAAIVLVSILVMTRFLKGFAANLAVLLGIVVGFVISITLGRVDFGGVANAGWLTVVLPFRFGLPVFDFWSAAGLCAVMIVMMIESTGQFLAVADMGGRVMTERDFARGLRADGVGNIIGGIFNTFTYTTFAQNVGLVQITGVLSRWAVAAGGVILIALGCFPKLAFVTASIPSYVIGGAAIVMFGMVSATGIKIFGKADFVANRYNLYIVAVSIAVAMIPVVADQFFSKLPSEVNTLFQSSVLIGTLSAVLLNLLFNGMPARNKTMTQVVAAE